MHPWERDARLFKEALTKGPDGYSLIIEVACTRSSEELLGARKAYHSLFDSSVEEDVASHVHGHERKVRRFPFYDCHMLKWLSLFLINFGNKSCQNGIPPY